MVPLVFFHTVLHNLELCGCNELICVGCLHEVRHYSVEFCVPILTADILEEILPDQVSRAFRQVSGGLHDFVAVRRSIVIVVIRLLPIL